MLKPYVCIEKIGKSYLENHKIKNQLVVLDGIDINIRKGEFVSIFGPNGCGKTTLLNIIAGLISQDSGRVTINGKAPQEAHIGYVFQNYPQSLLPWKKTIDNIAFPLELQGIDRTGRRKMAKDLVDSLALDIPLDSFPYQLSGGQQQMAVIARSLISNPDILLMDEPFSALNFQTRLYMQDKIQEIWDKTKITLIFVSHEIEEAIYTADRVIVFTNKPTHVANVFEPELKRPRTRDVTLSKDFLDLKKDILSLMDIAIK